MTYDMTWASDPQTRLSAAFVEIDRDRGGFPLNSPMPMIRLTMDDSGLTASFDLRPEEALDFAAHLVRLAHGTAYVGNASISIMDHGRRA